MKQFEYVIKDPVGIHARPAGLIVNGAKEFTSNITIEKGTKKADAKRVFAIMSLGVKCGDTVKVTVDGADEDAASIKIKELLENNL